MKRIYESVFAQMTERLRASLGADDYARRVRSFCWYRLGNRNIAPPDYLNPKWTLTGEILP